MAKQTKQEVQTVKQLPKKWAASDQDIEEFVDLQKQSAGIWGTSSTIVDRMQSEEQFATVFPIVKPMLATLLQTNK